MKHFAARIASLSAVVLALALSAPAFGQSSETADSEATTQTATAAATAARTSTVSAATGTATTATARAGGTVTREQTPKRVRRKIQGTSTADYRNPRGSVLSAFFFGVGYDSESGTIVAFGLGLGYALLTGVVPGVRAELIYDDGFGGQVATTLTLTPPLTWSLTPFLVGEIGLHWEPDQNGWMYGAGGGVYLGDPTSHLALQIGWIWRAIKLSGPDKDGSGPLLAITYRF